MTDDISNNVDSNKNYELHENRLGTTDSGGHRVYVYPEDVKGKWKSRRTVVYWFLMAVYLILPWINIKGTQSILLDIPKRTFIFFGNTFYANDAPLIIFLLIGFVFLLGFVTSLYGRAWCGWACPQTVFIQALYLKIERLVEGKARQRRNLDKAPLSLNKAFKKILKWFLFILVSLHITHSFLGYFVGARKLFFITLSPPTEHMTLFITMLVISTIVLLDFGWFREQFCIIACPYGRIQSVMMDDDSKIIAYDKKRGEPRRSKEVSPEGEGDCIDCNHCVKVCPTGIDIRRGTQMECIACTNCIDACDEIMLKINRPTGLLRFDSENGLKGKKSSPIRFRSALYLLILIGIITTFVYTLSRNSLLKVEYIRSSKNPFTVLNSKTGTKILNYYKVSFDHRNGLEYKVIFKTKNSYSNLELITPKTPLPLNKDHQIATLFFKFDQTLLINGSKKVIVQVFDSLDNKKILTEDEVTLVGPNN